MIQRFANKVKATGKKKTQVIVMPHQVFKDWRMLLAFGFGSGLSPIMPGTMGTIVGVLLYFCMLPLGTWGLVVGVVVGFVVGVHLCSHASRVLNVHDHGGIVWDEVIGLWITYFMVPLQWQWLLLGFVLFRVFDMVKPWPISLADKKLHGGFGIMFDDVLAGVAACIATHGIIRFAA